MNKYEFKSKVYKLGFNLKQFAEYLNIAYETVVSYSGGRNPVPGTVVRLLELLEENQQLKEQNRPSDKEFQQLKEENQELKALLEKINEETSKFSPNSPS